MSNTLRIGLLQSQTRSRSTCDTIPCFRHEKGWMSLNLRREAAPHATHSRSLAQLCHSAFQSQTRSRSTCDSDATVTGQLLDMFQSQTRSRSTCDEEKERMELTWKTNVSISDEKPL